MSDGTTTGDGSNMLGGRYELSELLGHGGMAEVRKAHDRRLDRPVAIKMLRPDLARDPSFQARFRREAQSAASLNAPSVVAVYDTGEDTLDGLRVPYIVMEYVDGQTLRDLLRGGQRLLPSRALEITDGVLVALDYSHRNGIIHRDVKPANVMLTTNGEVKVMDFGIARAVADSGATITQTSNVLGTAQYLSPEQARGEVVDARSDVYSAGCLMYELLANKPPFQGESPVAVAYQHVRENPTPPSSENPDVTPGMDAIVMKALAKNPDNRYQTAAEMRGDVQRALQGNAVTAPVFLAETATQPIHAITEEDTDTSKRKTGTYIALTVAVILILGLLGFAAWALLGGGGDKVRVPDVRGMSLAEATDEIEALNLEVGQQTPQASDEKKNTVLVQNPLPDTELEEGSSVDLTYSSGPQKVEVPDLSNLTQDQAIDRLREVNLVVEGIVDEDSDQPSGTVIRSKPPAGKQVKDGSAVVLVVSTGLVEIPDVVTMTEGEARAILSNEGFEVEVITQETDEATSGTVISQIPSGGSTARLGTVVTLTVATAPPSPSPTPTETDTDTKTPPGQTKSPGPPSP